MISVVVAKRLWLVVNRFPELIINLGFMVRNVYLNKLVIFLK